MPWLILSTWITPSVSSSSRLRTTSFAQRRVTVDDTIRTPPSKETAGPAVHEEGFVRWPLWVARFQATGFILLDHQPLLFPHSSVKAEAHKQYRFKFFRKVLECRWRYKIMLGLL
jgi:hypothetical protein